MRTALTVGTFGERGVAEIIYLVACFHMVGIILNGYAVAVPRGR